MASRASLLARVLATCCAVASGTTMVHRTSGKCLDLFAPCRDASNSESCERIPLADLREGTNLQLFHCNGKKNQQFELLENNRLRNPLTGLCVDILAPCKDHLRSPCQRATVEELHGEANIQLWTCQRDAGVLSNSYGNQKWDYEKGVLKNRGSKLCLAPVVVAGAESLTDMANVEARTCHRNASQIFDFKSNRLVEDAIADDVGFASEDANAARGWNLLRWPCVALVGVVILVAVAKLASGRKPSGAELQE